MTQNAYKCVMANIGVWKCVCVCVPVWAMPSVGGINNRRNNDSNSKNTLKLIFFCRIAFITNLLKTMWKRKDTDRKQQ